MGDDGRRGVSADPRPPLRWLPIGLGLAVAVLLIIVQLTRSTDSAEKAKSPVDDGALPTATSAKTTTETRDGSPSVVPTTDAGR